MERENKLIRSVSAGVASLAVFFLLFALGAWFFLLPDLRLLGRDRAVLERAATASLGGQAGAKQYREQAAAIEEQARALLPESDEQYDLAVQIDALSRNLKIPLSSFAMTAGQGTGTKAAASDEEGTTGGDAPASAVKRVTVTLGFTAPNYGEAQRFILGLTSLGRFLAIDQVSLSAPASGSVPGQVAVQVSAYAYYLPAKK